MNDQDLKTTAKIFINGRSQAVRLPKECRFKGDEVSIHKIGDVVIMTEKHQDPWTNFFKGLDMFPDDYLADGRPAQGAPGSREDL